MRRNAPYPAAKREDLLMGLSYGQSYPFESWADEARHHEQSIELHRQTIERLKARLGR